ncbi:MAG: hypothetical protein JSU85_05675 [Candidatus Zixiibacteriota bacterium]|nr:MAG: hypothetical protein JSU85_05675 [candidate division Zixibacteria bacterium]
MMLVFSNYGQARNERDTIWTRFYDAGIGQEVHSVEQTSDGGIGEAIEVMPEKPLLRERLSSLVGNRDKLSSKYLFGLAFNINRFKGGYFL